jgi:hypothetical protein
MDEDTAGNMVGFIGDILNRLARGSPSDMIDCYT